MKPATHCALNEAVAELIEAARIEQERRESLERVLATVIVNMKAGAGRGEVLDWYADAIAAHNQRFGLAREGAPGDADIPSSAKR